MKKTPKILPHLYKSKDILNTALPFAQGGELIDPIKGKDKDKDKKSTKFKPKGDVAPFVTSNPEEYAYRKAAYHDSLYVANKYNSIMPKPISSLPYYRDGSVSQWRKPTIKNHYVIGSRNTMSGDLKGMESPVWKNYERATNYERSTRDYPNLYNEPVAYEVKSHYFPKYAGRTLDFGFFKIKQPDSYEFDSFVSSKPRYQPPRQKIIFQEPPKPSKPTAKNPKVIQQKPVVNSEVIQPTPTPTPIPTPTPVIVNPELQKFVEERKPEPPGMPPGVREEPLEKLNPALPKLVSTTPLELKQEDIPTLPEYIQSPYHIGVPIITMVHHHSGQLIPHARPRIQSARVPGLVPSIVQKLTDYDKNFMEGYYDEEGNYVPGEIENAQEQNRPINFVGASSLRDLKDQKEYKKNLSKIFSNGGQINFVPSEYGSDAREQYSDGGPVYTYSKRPGSYYKRAADGSWMINNSSTGGQYVPIDDPTGQRTALLNKYAVVYNPPAQGLPKPTPLTPNTATQINEKIYPNRIPSETTQQVASRVMPQSKQQWEDYEFVKEDNARRKANLETLLITQGKTPEQAASIVGSYGSDWPTLEAENARALDTMARRTESIQSGNNPDKMSEYIPRAEQSTLGFARDVLFNPFTAAGYAIRGQEIPDYMGEKLDNGTLGYWSNGQFVQGRNLLDTAIDVATPIGWAHSGYNIADRATNNKSGDFWTEENAWDALNVIPAISLTAKGMKYSPLASRVNFAPKSVTSNLAVDAGNIIREPFYAPHRPSLLSPAVAPTEKKILGTIDEFGNLTDEAGSYFPAVDINSSPKNNTAIVTNKTHSIGLDEFRKAKEAAETNNWRFVTPKSELDFLASKYADEFSAKYGVPVEKLNSYDVAMYGKLREAEHIPTIKTVPATEKLGGAQKAVHNSFVNIHNPVLELNPTEELVTDAYTRGYDNLINQRYPFRVGEFYENEVAPILEQTILKNKFQQETPLIRGTRDFTIDGKASVLRNNEVLNNLKFSQLQEGDIFIPNSFTSTSIVGTNAGLNEIPVTSFTRAPKNFDHVIKAPAGQSYLYPNASNIQNYTIEMEAVLPKNLQFKVDKVVSDLERGYLETADDIKRGEYYGIGSNQFTKVPSKFFPSIKLFDKVKTVSRDLNTGELTYKKVSKKELDELIKNHNVQHQPVIPKYYFSIVNPYLFGGKLNKNC